MTDDATVSSDDPRLLKAGEILRYCGLTGEELRTSLEDCKKEFLRLQRHGSGSTRLINDAIHGPIELTPFIYKTINTPEFHRLKDIKQLGGANYVYPGANHTRFDHSIGVFYLAGQFAQHLQRQSISDFPDRNLFTDGEVVCAQIAGLCHDLGHGPFSHLFEHYVMISEKLKHEYLSVNIFKKLMVENTEVLAGFVSLKEDLGLNEFKLIEHMIRPPEKGGKLPEPWKHREFLCEIVANKSSGIDVDKWDYYARDCHYLGVTSDFQEKRCMLLGRIASETDDDGTEEFHIAFRDKELDNIYGMFRTRGILYQKAYQHKTIKAVERMIADAIMKIKHLPLIQVLGSGQAVSIKTALEEAAEGRIGSYLALTDSIIGVIKCSPTNLFSEDESKDLIKAKELLRRIETRDLYHCSGKVRIPKKKVPRSADSNKHQAASDSEQAIEDASDSEQAIEDGDKLWQALMAMSRQPEGESINEFLRPEKKQTIQKHHLWVPTEKIQLPSEDKDNPVDQIRFYKKPKRDGGPVELLTKEDVKEMTSLLVVPQAFVECEVRVYDKRRAIDRASDDQEALRDALLEWKRNADDKYNGTS